MKKLLSLICFFAGLCLNLNLQALAGIPMVVNLDASHDGFYQAMTWGVGSDGFRRTGDAKGVFYTISDRGPNIDCQNSEKVFGREICQEGKIFPMPSFNPSILKWNWSESGGLNLIKIIPLKNRDGRAISGLSNPWKQAKTESGIDLEGNELAFDAEGVDPEGLVVLTDGSFWVSEEYGPSLMHVSAEGEILERWVPEGLENDLRAAHYTVLGKLPAILKERKLNRGIESLTLSPDGSHLIAAMQSALENPDSSTAKSSRVVRFLTVDLKSSQVDGLYAYEMDKPEYFDIKGLKKVKTGDLKISSIVYFGNRLLVQERTDDTMKIFEFHPGENLLNCQVANETKSPTLEESTVNSQSKTLIWDAETIGADAPSKIEGMIAWDEKTLLLVNDNDFGLTGIRSEGYFLRLP